MKTCSVEDCGKPHSSRGLCKTHYNRAYYRKNVDTLRGDGLRYREANREALRAGAREYYKENAEKVKAYQRTYREKNAEKVRAYDRKRYQDRGEEVREYQRQYRQRHPEKIRAHIKKRNARKQGATGAMENIAHREIAERDGWRCHICGKAVTRKEWSLDHLVPLSAGGQHTRVNVALAHRRCNSQRHTGRIPAQLLLVG